jgi:hypothetical protein
VDEYQEQESQENVQKECEVIFEAFYNGNQITNVIKNFKINVIKEGFQPSYDEFINNVIKNISFRWRIND